MDENITGKYTLNSSWSVLNSAQWDTEQDESPVDFVRHNPIPHVALVTRGRYGDTMVGAPSVEQPHLKPYLYLHCRRVVKKIAGQLIRVGRDGKSLLSVTNLIVSISDLFKGYFEILSEDGQPVSARCIESVAELSDVFPEQILLRKECKCYAADRADGEMRDLCQKGSLAPGRVLTLVGRFHLKNRSFLRCFDEAGRSVFLKMTQKIKCSPLAQGTELVGVHSAASLMQKRLPLTVKLICGSTADSLVEACVRNNCHVNADSTGIVIRLRKIYKESLLFGYSIRKPEGRPFVLSLKTSQIRLARLLTQQHVMEHYDVKRLGQLCDDHVTLFSDQLHLIDSEEELMCYDKADKRAKSREKITSVDRLSSDASHHPAAARLNAALPSANRDDDDDDANHVTQKAPIISDEEIEQLYDYVRGGLTPRHERPPKARAPPPPPISSIPSRLAARSPDFQAAYGRPKRSDDAYYADATSRSAPVDHSSGDVVLGIARVFKTSEAARNSPMLAHRPPRLRQNNNAAKLQRHKTVELDDRNANVGYCNGRLSACSLNNLYGTRDANHSEYPVVPVISRRPPLDAVPSQVALDNSLVAAAVGHVYRKKQQQPAHNRRRPVSMSVPDRSPMRLTAGPPWTNRFLPTGNGFYPPHPMPGSNLLANNPLRRSFITLVTLDDQNVNIHNNVDYGNQISTASRPAADFVALSPLRPMPPSAVPFAPRPAYYVKSSRSASSRLMHQPPYYASQQLAFSQG